MNIKSLLAKRKWTGEEIGKALLTNLVNDVKNIGKNNKPLFSQDDLNRMEQSIDNERDYTAYGVYRNIYSAVVDNYNRGQGLYQQFYNGYYRTFNYLQGAMSADRAAKDAERYPLIVTQAQYDALYNKAENEARATKVSFSTILFDLLYYFSDQYKKYDINDLEENLIIPPAIAEALKAAETEPATNKRILNRYNTDYEAGYYELPDGRRSDQMSPEEWTEALEESQGGKLTKDGENYQQWLFYVYKLFYDGADTIRATFKEKTGKEPPECDDAELTNALAEVIRGDGYKPLALELEKAFGYETSITQWHYYPEPPELTKLDVLCDCLDSYCGALEDSGDVNERQGLKEFRADYPALYKAVKEYIEGFLPAAKGLKANQLFKSISTYGELADKGIAIYKEYTKVHRDGIIAQYENGNYTECSRACFSGIAIIKDPCSWDLNEKGEYKERPSLLAYFDTLYTIDEDERIKAEIKSAYQKLIKPALSFLYAFNALMRIFGAVYGVDEMDAIQLNTSSFERQLDAYNNVIYMFYFTVYGDKEDKERKRAIIKELFKPIDIEALKPSQESIDEITTELKELGLTEQARQNLKNIEPYFKRLMGEGAH